MRIRRCLGEVSRNSGTWAGIVRPKLLLRPVMVLSYSDGRVFWLFGAAQRWKPQSFAGLRKRSIFCETNPCEMCNSQNAFFYIFVHLVSRLRKR